VVLLGKGFFAEGKSIRSIIIAGGKGTRLETVTSEIPKALTPLGNGQTILGHQLELLVDSGVKDITLVTGYFHSQVEAYARSWDGLNIDCSFQGHHQDANYILNLYLTGNPCVDGEDVLLLHGDVVMDYQVLETLLSNTGSAVAVNKSFTSKKDFNARVERGLVKAIGVEFQGSNDYFCLPAYKLTSEMYDVWLGAMKELLHQGQRQAYAETALNTVLDMMELYPAFFDAFGIEIDTPEDLAEAQYFFNPSHKSENLQNIK
jgi:NDP-sugar pyrophosphorylase family protein